MDQIVSRPETGDIADVFRRAMALSRTTPPPTLAERRDRLARLRAIVTDNESRFAQAISADFGNRSTTETLVAETLFLLAEIKHASKSLGRWMAAKHVPTELQYFPAKNRLLPQPLGVVGIIAPWNYPLQLTLAPAIAAIAAGNRVMIKPSELVPSFSALLRRLVAEKFDDTEVTVTGIEDHIAQEFAALPFDHLIFTGSTRVGRLVAEAAGRNLTPVTLELGGKSPILVFADADLDDAVGGALLGNFYSAGEVCSNGTRVFVQRAALPAFLEKLVARTAAMVTGDPLDPATHVGALISTDHMEKVLGYIEAGKREGATLVTGGGRASVPGLEAGAFVTPTVFADCTDDMTIVREEIFGPVMSVLVFDDEEEAIARANATDFGLAAGVFTRDINRAHRVIAELQAGTCWINAYNLTPIELPFGGYKRSGLGRENSRAAVEHYTQAKSVYVNLGRVDSPY